MLRLRPGQHCRPGRAGSASPATAAPIDLGGDVTGSVSKLVFTILSAVADAEPDRTASASPR